MAGSGGFAVTISAVDNATKTLDGVNRSLAKLSAPAERFNKALAKFGDTSGISRVGESVAGLGRSASDAFRSLDRMASPMAAITGAASVAGIVELSRRWAEFGTQVGNVAYRVNMPIERLGTLRGAMRLSGGSAADLDSGLRGLSDTLNAAAWGRDPQAVQMFTTLGIATRDANGNIRSVGDVLYEVADKIKGLPQDTQRRVLEGLGMGDQLLPFLKNGSAGVKEWEQMVRRTGAVMTPEMVEHANAMNKAWTRLGLDFEGIGNRIVDSWSGTITGILSRSSDWIENNKKTADSIAEIGTAVSALGSIKAAAWVARLLGFATVSAGASIAGTLALPASLSGDTPSDPAFNQPAGSPGYFGQGGTFEQWARRQFNWGGGAISVPSAPSSAAATMQRAHDFFRSKGLTEEQTAGVLANIAAESGFDPNKSGDNGTSYGLFQYHAGRLDALRKRYGTAAPSADQQLDFAWDELRNGGQRQTLDRLVHAGNERESAFVFTTGFENPANAANEGIRRANAAPQFLQGNVQVEVTLKGAPAGTSARVTSTGAVSAPPPRIETSMPGVH